ncbi:MAG TPA: class IV adenylate cyclase [Thermoguttaceae bacterium]|nr:class IV adenylate cyclase [Thermoguttaceae bacterium]
MDYEVEQKFPVEDLGAVEARLGRLGAAISEPCVEVDLYFNHPTRDYARTDEALRLRRVGTVNRITYKGPKLDATTKTREELELALPDGEAAFEGFSTLLRALGFVPVGEVRKQRRKAHVPWQGRRVEVSLDQVDRLGTFVELELVVRPEEFEEARACIASLAEELRLTESERRSYLCLLLAKETEPRS